MNLVFTNPYTPTVLCTYEFSKYKKYVRRVLYLRCECVHQVLIFCHRQVRNIS